MSATKTKANDPIEQLEASSVLDDPIARAAENLRKAEDDLMQAQSDAVRSKGPSGYDIAQQIAAEEGRAHQPVDQRTGRPAGEGAYTAEQRRAQLLADQHQAEMELEAFIETIRLAVGEPAPLHGKPGAYDQRKGNQLLREALERLAATGDQSDLASRALQRLDAQSGILKRGVGLAV